MAVIERYCLTDVQDEVRNLIARGLLDRQQRIYELRKFFSDRQWSQIERLLDEQDHLLRGRMIDLVSKESWTND